MKRTNFEKMLKVLFIFFVSFFGLISCNARQNNDKKNKKILVVASYGGAYQEAQRKAFFEPFSRKFNVVIREVTHTGDLAKIKVMVKSGNVTWDVISVEQYIGLIGAKQNLYEKIDYKVVNKGELLEQAINDYGVANCFWSTVLAYNSKYFSNANHPQNWKDFWDVKKYPGKRSLRNSPVSTLEFALLADGVDKKNLYPLDIERAFKSLNKIKDMVNIWWSTGEQPVKLLSEGKIVLTSVWSGRAYDARKEGKPVQEIWEGGLIDSDWWVVPKGTKNKKLAMEFINFALGAEQQANFVKYIPYGPVNKNAIKIIPKSILNSLPTSPSNIEKQIFINSKWWEENQKDIQERWEKWLSK